MSQLLCAVPDHLMLIYGAGGLGKSTLCAQAAAYVWKKFGKKTRVVGGDGGGNKAFAPLIEKGIVDYWAIDTYSEQGIFANLALASKGWWPKNPGEIDSILLPPLKKWKPCPKCGVDTGSEGVTQAAKCPNPKCGTTFPNTTRLDFKVDPINGFEDVGAYVFEGATAFGRLMLERLRVVDPGGGRQVKDGDFTIAGLGKQHYGDAQNYAGQHIANSRLLPVPIVLWTALELRGVDEDGKPAYGPAFPGKALLEKCIPWFSDVIHVDRVAKMQGANPVRDADGMEASERKLYLETHYPADIKPYGFKAKSSAPLGGGMPLVLPFPEKGNTMQTFFEKTKEAKEKAGKELLGE